MTDEELRTIFDESEARTRRNLERLRAEMNARGGRPKPWLERRSFDTHTAQDDKRLHQVTEAIALLRQKVDRDFVSLRHEMKRRFNRARRKR
jgi:hypothetical protein